MSDYDDQLNINNTVDESYTVFDLDVADDKVQKLVINDLNLDVSYWNQKPWELEQTDKENIDYYLGNQIDPNKLTGGVAIPYVDNRLFASTRAIIAYVFGRMAKPEITPSKGDDRYIRMARQMEDGLYQHALNHDVNAKFRLAGKNLVVRKRGIIKLRYDENVGAFGDIITENIDPSDCCVDRFAGYGQDPNRFYQKLKGTIQELCVKFPDREQEILKAYGIKRAIYSQTSRMVTYYECWFSYWEKGQKSQGVCWFIPNTAVVLGKMRNPNWLYKGSDKKQKIANITDEPIKPYIWFNYLNTGRSFIDETSLFDQAKPQQDILNKRGRQIMENADYANPRILVNGGALEQGDADKIVNKSPKTVVVLNKMKPEDNINNAVVKVEATMLPDYVISDKYDTRNEIDTMMGTPSVFRGEQPQNQSKTLGQDLLIKQQAGALQDDLVVVINEAYARYYKYLAQMFNVYMTDDYWIMTKGNDGRYTAILLSSDSIDTNVKVGVQANSNLPLDRDSQSNVAMNLAGAGLIDPLTLYRDLGLPDAEERAERLQKYMLDKMAYSKSIEQQLYNAEADADITLVIANKVPEERDNYDEKYLNHFNQFMTTNRFLKLQTEDPDAAGRVVAFLNDVSNKAAEQQALKDSMLDPAGMATATLVAQGMDPMNPMGGEDPNAQAGGPPQQVVQ